METFRKNLKNVEIQVRKMLEKPENFVKIYWRFQVMLIGTWDIRKKFQMHNKLLDENLVDSKKIKVTYSMYFKTLQDKFEESHIE